MKWYYWLIIAVLVVLGISTFIPIKGFPANLIGYSSIDPFTPISAVILWVMAGVFYWYGKKKEKRKS